MIPASANGQFQTGAWSFSPNFQDGRASGPPGGAKTNVRMVNPMVWQNIHINTLWDGDANATRDLFKAFLFSPKDRNPLRVSETQLGKRKGGPVNHLGEDYDDMGEGTLVRKRMIMHEQVTWGGALPHINYLLAKAQVKRLGGDYARDPWEILESVLPLWLVGVHQTQEPENDLNQGTLQWDGRYAPGRAPATIVTVTQGIVHTHNVWDPKIAVGTAVGFELYPKKPENGKMFYRLSENGNYLWEEIPRTMKVVWQIRPVYGPQLDRIKVELVGGKPYPVHQWVVGEVVEESRFLRRVGVVGEDVDKDMNENIRLPTVGVRMDMANCHSQTDRMDHIVEPFLVYANTRETPSSSLRVMFPDTPIPQLKAARREARLARIKNPILRRDAIRREMEEQQRAVTQHQDTREDLEKLLAHIENLEKWVQDAEKCLRTLTPHPTHSDGVCFCRECLEKSDDFLCLCTRLTLLRDHFWGSRPRSRPYAYTYTPLLWVMSMWYRILRMRILGRKVDHTADFFCGKGFPVPMVQREDLISSWTPETMQQALHMLVFSYTEGGVKVGPDLSLYWEALQDRLAMFCTEAFDHPNYNPNGLLKGSYVDDEEMEESTALQDDAEQGINRQIREHIEKEQMRVADEAEAAGEDVDRVEPFHVRARRVDEKMDRELREKLKGLEGLVVKIIGDDDEEEEEQEEEEEEEEKVTFREMGRKVTKRVRLRYHWARTVSLYANTISSWQYPLQNTPPYTDKSLALEREVRKRITRAALTADEARILQQSQDWCTGRLLTLGEREKFRMDGGGHVFLSALSIVKSVRSYQDQGGWPKHVEHALYPDNPLHPQFMNYASWWWLQQMLPRVPTDSCVFLWDAQEEFLAFDRHTIHTPLICRVGGSWVVLEEWGKGKVMEGKWFHSTLPQVLAYWILLVWEKYKNTVTDYYTGTKYDLKATEIHFLLEEVTEQYSLNIAKKGEGGGVPQTPLQTETQQGQEDEEEDKSQVPSPPHQTSLQGTQGSGASLQEGGSL